MKFLTDFTYRNLHGFARFPGDSTALVGQGRGYHLSLAVKSVVLTVVYCLDITDPKLLYTLLGRPCTVVTGGLIKCS